MKIESLSVALLSCKRYDRSVIKAHINRICQASSFTVARSSQVLLKPNLISGKGHDGLACTHPEFVAAAAEWFVDQGAKVMVGDSPAFGSARKVMVAIGLTEALAGLPVQIVDFSEPRRVRLASSIQVGIATAALDCDVLVSLPKIKTHVQLGMTMAIKNYFGTVVGMRKPLIHSRFGDVGNAFEALLIDLLEVLPDGFSLVDGVVAMQSTGPIHGIPHALGVIAGSTNPVAVDTAIMAITGIEPEMLPLWRESRRRNLPGVLAKNISYPLGRIEDVQADGFRLPGQLKPISFHPWRLLTGGVKRIVSSIS